MSPSCQRAAWIAAAGLVSLLGCKRTAPTAAPPPPAAAVVDGVRIPVADLQRELDRVRKGEGGEAKAAPQDAPKLARAVLDALVDRAIVLHRARTAGVEVSEAEVQRATEALAEDARKGGAAFESELVKAGQTQEQLAEEMRDRLLAEKYVAEQTAKEVASAAEARAWYEQHRAEFEEPEAVHCQQLAVRTPDEAKSALDQLRAGAPFEQLAQRVSISPDSRNGGDLGWFARGTMPKAFDDACFSLGSGKISGVVASPYGFHVFKNLGRRAPRTRKFDEVKAEAARRATLEKRAQAERQLLRQLRSQAEVRVDEAALASIR